MGRFEEKEQSYIEELEKLGRKLRASERTVRKTNQSTQVGKPGKPSLDSELFNCVLLQANAIEQFLK